VSRGAGCSAGCVAVDRWPPVWREVAVGLGSYALYLAVRRMVWTPRGRALADRNARSIAALERRLGWDVEQRVQSVAMRARPLVRVANAGYAAGNVGLSVGWLIRLYRRSDPSFARERRAAVAAFLGALPVFLALPTAPPRSQRGFVDTLADQGIDLDHPVLVRLYNPIAAMPSHHVAFAVVTGLGIAARSRRRGVRLAWFGYPWLVATIVVATANHFVLDVAAGAMLGAAARRCTR
jgi:PAP2 superfamily